MNFMITLPERMILESVFKYEKTLEELCECTRLDKIVLQNILPTLITKNLLLIQNKKYYINKNINADMRKELSDNQNLKTELTEVVADCVRQKLINHNQQSFKLKKVFLSARDKVIFNAHVKNLEDFLDSISSRDHKTADETIFFWGENTYEAITHNIINY